MDQDKLMTALGVAAADNPAAMVAVARQMQNCGRQNEAATLCSRALALAPGDGWAKHSDKLDLLGDLNGRPDLVVSEIVASNLLEEGVLPSHERIMRDLAHGGTKVIPARGIIRVALAQDLRDPGEGRKDVCGFDVSAFLALAKRSSFIRRAGDTRPRFLGRICNDQPLSRLWDAATSRYRHPIKSWSASSP